MAKYVAIVSNGAATSTGNYPTTSTGPGYVSVGGPARQFSVATVHDSTKQVAWTLQGDIGGAGAWTNLNAAASSTGSTIVSSTAGHVVTALRINVSGNQSTGDVTTVWRITGVD